VVTLQSKACHACLVARRQGLLIVWGCVWWVLADRCSSSQRRAVGLVRQE